MNDPCLGMAPPGKRPARSMLGVVASLSITLLGCAALDQPAGGEPMDNQVDAGSLGDAGLEDLSEKAAQRNYAPTADAYIDSSRNSSNFGSKAELLVDNAPSSLRALVRFDVPSTTQPIVGARLRFFVTNGTADGPRIILTSNSWSESGVTWSKRPSSSGATVANLANVSTGWKEVDVSSAVKAGGTYSFYLIGEANDGLDFASRESANAPQLVVLTSDSSDQCPNDPNKLNPGLCGCGTPDTDSDRDGTADCRDGCPLDSAKLSPDTCGCGVPEGSCGQPAEAQPVTLPVEVLGVEGTTEQRTLWLSSSQAASARSLWLQVNNLSYENKASVQINSGAWLSLNHSTVRFPPKEQGYGGMAHGGLSTIRFTIPASGLRAGQNVIRFRFDRSDGISMGFRIVRMNVLNATGGELLSAATFVHEDPERWTGPYTDAASIAEGERLWREANLWSHYLPNGRQGFWYSKSLPARKAMRAKCADCHTQDGRDLEIFAYSNHSIIERAKFHGLSQREGELIASYIRSLSAAHDDVGRPGRPWNPPFQPGPDVAKRPVWQWAAGAGLDAVLETDAQMLPDMFGANPTQQSVNAYFDSKQMWDTSTQRVSIQLPDWKRWLPMVHPLDAFDRNGWIDGSVAYHPIRGYEELRAYFAARQFPYGGLGAITSAIRTFYKNYRLFFEQGGSQARHWRTRDGHAVTKGLQPGVPVELAKTSLARLMAVQFFEVHHEFRLQDKAPILISAVDQPRERQWLGKQTQVFEVPPHLTACEANIDCLAFLGQAERVGIYESTAWYQLQQTINPGIGMMNETTPVDYNYVPRFILLSSVRSGIKEPLRFYHSSNVMYQTRTWSGATTPNNCLGFNIRVMGPWLFHGTDESNSHHELGFGTMPRLLDSLKSGLTRWVVEAQLRQFVEAVNRPENALSGWLRQGSPDAKNDCSLEPASLSMSAMPSLSESFKPASQRYAQKIYWTLPKFVELGVDCAVIRDVANWATRAWPNVNWNSTLGRCR